MNILFLIQKLISHARKQARTVSVETVSPFHDGTGSDRSIPEVFLKRIIRFLGLKKSKSLAVFFLSALVWCVSCQKPQASSPPCIGDLPTPPYSGSSHHQMIVDNEPRSAFAANSVEDVVASIERLQSRPDRSRYRSHLEELSTRLFQKLATSKDIDAVIMTLLATASCHHPLSRTISRDLIRSENPIIQLAAIQTLSSLNSADANDILSEALRSDYPVVRLEAGWHIASKRTQNAFFQIDALSHKLPDVFLAYMPELFAVEGSAASQHRLRQLLFDPNEEVIVETMLSIGRHRMTSLATTILSIESFSPAVIEAQAFALRICDSESSRKKLRALASHADTCVRIQAALSLLALGETEYQSTIVELAQGGDLFAMAALGACPEPFRLDDLHDRTRSFQINEALSLLSKKDPLCISPLKTILSLPEDQVFYANTSVGHSLSFWDITSVHAFDQSLWQTVQEQSLLAKEKALVKSLDLPKQDFEAISTSLLSEQRIDLYPCLLRLMENQQSDTTIALLQKEALRVGAPYNRAFATLALVRLGIETDPEALVTILDFSREKKDQPWRIPLPWMASPHTDEKGSLQQAAATAQLYISTIETLAEQGTPQAIEILTKELHQAPRPFLPFIVASLLQATL